MPHLIGVASGKGGVGKTTFSVNLALELAKKSVKTVLVDADMGLANAQLHLGIRATRNISDYLLNDLNLSEVITNVEPNLDFIPGASGNRTIANLPAAAIVAMTERLKKEVDSEAIIIDVAAGISDQILSILHLCDSKLIVMTDEPTSIADAYGITKLIHSKEGLSRVFLVPNMVSNSDHGARVFENMNKLTMSFLGQPLQYLGSVREDNAVVQSVKKRLPLYKVSNESLARANIREIADKTINSLIANMQLQPAM